MRVTNNRNIATFTHIEDLALCRRPPGMLDEWRQIMGWLEADVMSPFRFDMFGGVLGV